ncbi:MAG: T9SS type A sorting domain-containing protein [Bacteroidota bacterium]
MKWKQNFVLILSFLTIYSITHAQSVWEKTFIKANHTYQDYSITTAQDGSEDLVLAGTVINQATGQHQINVIRIEDQTSTVVFDENYHPGQQAWGMSIASYQTAAGSGYAVTGFAEVNGVRQTLVMTIDETGTQIDSKLYDQESSATSSMGLNIQATPNAADEGFVLVGMTHEDLAGSTLRFADKKGFCLKLDQNLNITWETYFDSPLGSAYTIDYDGASHVIPTDQGYFITGGKNGLTLIGQQRQAMLALMLDPSGAIIWDSSSFTGNAIDNGASAYYDQANQEIYLLTNISVTHHLGLMVYDAASGAVNYTKSLESYTSNGELDKYGYALVKAPFQDKLLIQGRGRDFGWATNPPSLGQPAFIVDYDMTTQQFGVNYLEPTLSETLNTTGAQDPFFTNALRTFYYPQSMTNINAGSSAFISYDGDNGDPANLIVRKFRHPVADQYEFCEEGLDFVLDTFRMANDFPGEPFDEPVFTTSPTDVTLIGSDEVAEVETNCLRPGEEPFICEGNLVQNGDFETGTPTTGDEDITNATNWGGIWSTPGFSTADFYNTTTALPPPSLSVPAPTAQGNFGAFWCRNQGGNPFREGIMNELSAPVGQNTGVYELTLKVACLFEPFNNPSLAIYGTTGALGTGGPLVDATTPVNAALFSDVYTIGIHPIPDDCDNNYTTITFTFDTQAGVGFPATGFDHIFLTRADGMGSGTFLAVDDVCLRWVRNSPFLCEGNLVQNGDFETGTPTTGDEDISNATNWGGIWNTAGFSTGDFYNTTTAVAPLGTPAPASQGNFGAFWCRNQGGNPFREGIMNELVSTINQNSGVYELTLKVACLFEPFNDPALVVYGSSGALGTGGPLVDASTPVNSALFPDVYTIGAYLITDSCDNNFTTLTFTFDTQTASFPAGGIDHIFLTRADGSGSGTFLAVDDVCLRWIRESVFECEENLVQNGDFEMGTPTTGDEDISNAANWGGIWSTPGFSTGDFYNTTTAVTPLGTPTPVSQNNFGAFWCRNQGGNPFREGIMNELTTTINQNSGVYQLTLKVACLFEPFNDPALAIYGTTGSIGTGGPLVDASTPVNAALFPDVYTIGTYAMSTDNCDNNFTTITYTFDTQDVSFPVGGINHIFLTRVDGSGSGTFLAVDDLCLQWIGESVFVCDDNYVQNGDFEDGTPSSLDEDISNALGWGAIWSDSSGVSTGDFYNTTTDLPPPVLAVPTPVTQNNFAGFWSRIQGGTIYREGVLNELNSTIMPNSGIFQLTFKTACLFTPSSPASMSIYVANGSIGTGGPLVNGTTPINDGLFLDSWEFATHAISTDCDNNFQTVSYLLDTHDPSFPASGINAIFFTRTDGVSPGAYVAIDDVCLEFVVNADDIIAEAFPLKLYPNPAHDQIRLEWSDQSAEVLRVQLFDSSGRLVLSQPAPENRGDLDISQLPNGLYMLRISTADGRMAMKKVIKQ